MEPNSQSLTLMFNLYIRGLNDRFHLAKNYPNYLEAVLSGQELGGYGQFYVDTGTRVPSREEQLLQPFTRKPKTKTKTKKQQILDSI
jgi:hypothetical protein